MNDAAKAVLSGLVKTWSRYAAEKAKLETTSKEVAALAAKTIQGALAFLKEQHLEIECASPQAMAIMNIPVEVTPVVEGNFPNLKTSIILRCGEAHRTIVIDLALNVNAGGTSFPFENFKRGIPDSFTMNAVEFVKDAFLYVARTGGKPLAEEAGSPPEKAG